MLRLHVLSANLWYRGVGRVISKRGVCSLFTTKHVLLIKPIWCTPRLHYIVALHWLRKEGKLNLNFTGQ